MANDHVEHIRIVQETVAGKEITFAHVMGGPAPVIYQKLGLNPQVDYRCLLYTSIWGMDVSFMHRTL